MNSFIRRLVMKGYQLVAGRHVLECFEELNRTQWLKHQELSNVQFKKLYKLLVYAYAHVPYYRRTFDEVGFQPTDILTDVACLHKLPILTKAIIRENFSELMTIEKKRRRSMSQRTTGGSTGHPLIFMQDSHFRDYFTADYHRHLTWAGWKFGQPQAYIWGASFEVHTSQVLRTHLMNWVLNRFLTNAYVLSEESMGAFINRVRKRRPRILFGYASSLCHFAEFVQKKELDDIRFDAIFSSAEVLYPVQRQYIEETFQSKIFNSYGLREIGIVACECDVHTDLHVSIENNYVEIVRDFDSIEPAQPGETGHIVVTNLNNYGMPFIRYSTEDMGAWSTIEHCQCGRKLPLMEMIQGRRIDMFKAKDGRAVWGGIVSPMFGIEGVKRFQLVQKSLDLLIVRIVKESELNQDQLDAIKQAIQVALGYDVEVRFEFPEEISVLDSGKYRYAISEIKE